MVADDGQDANTGYSAGIHMLGLYDQEIGNLAIRQLDEVVEKNIEHAVGRRLPARLEDGPG